MSREPRIESIQQQFYDQWVVVQVTRRDRYHVPVAGRVLFHGVDKQEVYDSGFKFGRQNPEAELYFFFAGELAPKHVAVMLGTV